MQPRKCGLLQRNRLCFSSPLSSLPVQISALLRTQGEPAISLSRLLMPVILEAGQLCRLTPNWGGRVESRRLCMLCSSGSFLLPASAT